jgi:Holliday junction resolvasome RuvABC DNA-binding subunit
VRTPNIKALRITSRILADLKDKLQSMGKGTNKQTKLSSNMVAKLIKAKETGCSVGVHNLVKITYTAKAIPDIIPEIIPKEVLLVIFE